MEATGGKDLISSLPDDILVRILSFLPVESTIRTSILSTRWRHLWKYNLVIDFTMSTYSLLDSEDYSFVSRFLALHRAPKLQRFAICRSGCKGFVPEVELWVAFAATRDVQELEIIFYDVYFEVPLSLYAAKSIKSLYLSGVCFSSPPNFNGFFLLKDLSIGFSGIGDEVVEAIVSSCPILESLTLQRCSGLNKVKIASWGLKRLVFDETELGELLELEIEAPNLVCFKYQGSVVTFCLKHHCVAEVELLYRMFLRTDIGYEREFQEADFGYVKTLMDDLSCVKVLSVSSWFTEFMATAYYSIGDRCLAFQNLKKFCWSGWLKAKGNVISLVAFLGDCASLELIELDFNYLAGDPRLGLKVEEELKIRMGCLYQLRKIKVIRYAGIACEMELIKLLLEKAIILDTFSMAFAYGSKEHHTKLEKQVSLFPRGSPHA
ncbi:F-box/LRR-repeat protein [Actinidia chinensis var. chinensis]|uniref:F-box/LRR-repeat protein n=1 Tax=Actinidia chinensis var. chinensis TaxID=1590841 RepID=A0A2R6QVL1_ACTCC|nr:F-box/LRR-repeat protein [Actinidia chinensis var. chinensis]